MNLLISSLLSAMTTCLNIFINCDATFAIVMSHNNFRISLRISFMLVSIDNDVRKPITNLVRSVVVSRHLCTRQALGSSPSESILLGK